jgi:hypothetical protein
MNNEHERSPSDACRGTVVLRHVSQGQNCSGGSDGGMDATGNHAAIFTSVATHAATAQDESGTQGKPCARKIAATSQEGRRFASGPSWRPNRALSPARVRSTLRSRHAR